MIREVTTSMIECTSIPDGRLPAGIFLQELQGNFPPPEEPEEPPTCPTCGKSTATVYCSRLPDTDYRLMLRTTGRSRYTALHRVDTQLPPQ